jgi:hypothetical protein
VRELAVQLQQHALLIAKGLFEKAARILDSSALPGLSALAVNSSRDLALAGTFREVNSIEQGQPFVSGLETLIAVVKMAAEGIASSVIKYCPLLLQALQQVKVLPEVAASAAGYSDSDAVRNTHWVLPVEVSSTTTSRKSIALSVLLPAACMHQLAVWCLQEACARQVLAGHVPSTIAVEAVMLQYSVNCHLDELLCKIYSIATKPPLSHSPFTHILPVVRTHACKMHLWKQDSLSLQHKMVNELSRIGPSDCFMYSGVHLPSTILLLQHSCSRLPHL